MYTHAHDYPHTTKHAHTKHKHAHTHLKHTHTHPKHTHIHNHAHTHTHHPQKKDWGTLITNTCLCLWQKPPRWVDCGLVVVTMVIVNLG